MSFLNILFALAPLVSIQAASFDPLRKTCVAPNGDPLCSVEFTFQGFRCPKEEESDCKKDLCEEFSAKFLNLEKKISVEECGASASPESGRRLSVALLHDDQELDIKIFVKGHVADVEKAVIDGIDDLREVLNARWNYNDENDDGDDVQRARVDFERTIITCNQDYCLNHGKAWKLISTVPTLGTAAATCDQASNTSLLACKDICCEQVPCTTPNGSLTKHHCEPNDGFKEASTFNTGSCAYFDCMHTSNHWKNDSSCCEVEFPPCSAYFRLNSDADKIGSADNKQVCAANSFVKMALCADAFCTAEVTAGTDPAGGSTCCVPFNGTGDQFEKVTEVAFKSNFDFEGTCDELFSENFWDDVIVAIAAALDDNGVSGNPHLRFTAADITLKDIPLCSRRRLEKGAEDANENKIVFEVRSKSEAQLRGLRSLSEGEEKARLEEKLDAVLKQVGSVWSKP